MTDCNQKPGVKLPLRHCLDNLPGIHDESQKNRLEHVPFNVPFGYLASLNYANFKPIFGLIQNF